MDGANAISQTKSDPNQLGVLDEAALLPEYLTTHAVLNVLPVELRIARLGDENGTAVPRAPELTAEQIARAKLRLTTLMTDFRAAALWYPGLHHTLVVHSRRNPDWTGITPLDTSSSTMRLGQESVGWCWTQQGLQAHGFLHSRENVAGAGTAFRRLAKHASRVVRDICPTEDQFDPECRWVLELYRTARATAEFSARPFFYSLGCEIPVRDYGWLRAGQSLSPFEKYFERPARALEHPPSCSCSRLSEDCFTASAMKLETLLFELNSGSQQWRSGAWFVAVTDGRISLSALQKARNGKRRPVRSRKPGACLEYEVQSVCRYRPDLRDRILEHLN
ncbi:MAG: hypothetical protein ACF8GE_09735 [Phycisphaerales bacterium JB043]